MSNFYLNFVYDILLEAHFKKFDFKKLEFAKSNSPLSLRENSYPVLNDINLNNTIELNLRYRFPEFDDFVIELKKSDYENNKEIIKFFYLMISYADSFSAFDMSFLYKKLLEKYNIINDKTKEDIEKLSNYNIAMCNRFLSLILNKLVKQLQDINLAKAFDILFPNGNLYKWNARNNQLILYCNESKSDIVDTKIKLFEYYFIPFDCKYQVCYDKHFGIIGNNATMIIDGITILS